MNIVFKDGPYYVVRGHSHFEIYKAGLHCITIGGSCGLEKVVEEVQRRKERDAITNS